MNHPSETLRILLPNAAAPVEHHVQLEELISTLARVAADPPSWQATQWARVRKACKRLQLGTASGGSELAEYQKLSLDGLASFVDVNGKTVLEVGSDESGNVLRALERMGARFALGIDVWRRPVWFRVLSPKLLQAYGDITSLLYAAQSFDVILNIATFEHIHNLDTTLAEMHRLVKPGGYIYAHFGPIWSSAVGHHIYADLDGHSFRFDDPTKNPLEDFDHLVYDRDQLAEKLSATWDAKTVEFILMSVFDHPHINRMFHHEICGAIRRSPFDVVVMTKNWEIPVPPQLEPRLKARHGHDSDYSCAGMQVVLKRVAGL